MTHGVGVALVVWFVFFKLLVLKLLVLVFWGSHGWPCWLGVSVQMWLMTLYHADLFFLAQHWSDETQCWDLVHE